VVTDRNLVTGQNPFSSNLIAETFLHELALARAQAVTLAGHG
jgi:putative intracellular protease/amidase